MGRALAVFMVGALALAGGCKKQLVVEIRGQGQVTLPDLELVCTEPSCTFEVPSGPQNVVTTPGAEHSFGAFEAGCSGTAPSCALDVGDDARLVVRFDPLVPITLEVKGDGKIVVDEQKITCPGQCEFKVKKGTEVRLRRQAGKDSFVGYSGDCPDKKECTFVADNPRKIVAEFAAPPGTVELATLAGAASLEDGAVSVALDEKGGVAIAAVNGSSLTVTRLDAAGKQVFSQKVGSGKANGAPGLAFFGDDLLIVLGDDDSSTVIRLSPDGKDERYKKLHRGCPGLRRAHVEGDGVFAAGRFKGSHTCGDIELISSGGHDILAARFSVDDGSLVWSAQVGSARDDRFDGIAVTPEEELVVGWTALKDGGRVSRVNPAGKPFPESKFGNPTSSTEVLDVKLVDKKSIRIMGHIVQPTEFGGDTIGPPARDNVKRIVVVKTEPAGRHLASAVVGRSTCDAKGLCAFDVAGGYARANQDLAGDGEIALRVSRAGADGTERWSSRIKGSGKGVVGASTFLDQGAGLLVVGVLQGTLDVEGQPLEAKTPSVFVLRLKD